MPCSVEINTLPQLGGCPSDTEMFIVSGAVLGAGTGGYGLRSWATLKSCVLGGIGFPALYTVVGEGIEPVFENGDTTYTTADNTISNSIFVVISGTPIYQGELSDAIYIGVEPSENGSYEITFYNYSLDNPTVNLGLQSGMQVIIYYATI